MLSSCNKGGLSELGIVIFAFAKDVRMRQTKETVVVGLGNLLMRDEGIGLYIVRELSARVGCNSDIGFVELGCSFISVLHTIARRRKAVIIDCAYMSELPGTMRRFSPDDVASRKAMLPLSLHQANLLDALELSRKLGEHPEEVIIFGIQPESVALGEGLSLLLRERLQNYVETVGEELCVSL